MKHYLVQYTLVVVHFQNRNLNIGWSHLVFSMSEFWIRLFFFFFISPEIRKRCQKMQIVLQIRWGIINKQTHLQKNKKQQPLSIDRKKVWCIYVLMTVLLSDWEYENNTNFRYHHVSLITYIFSDILFSGPSITITIIITIVATMWASTLIKDNVAWTK